MYSCAKQGQPLPYNSRPLYCSVMSNLIICFTGFRKKEELGRLCRQVHHMGGSIRREFSSRVTQLVANSVHGERYRVSMWYTLFNGWTLPKLHSGSLRVYGRQLHIDP